MALTPCLPQGEEINHEFPDELYVLPPEEIPQEPSPPGALAADSQSGASRQVHRDPVGSATGGVGGHGAHPCPCVIPSGRPRATPANSQELVTDLESQEDVSEAQVFLAVPQQRRRTASELLMSRWAWGQRGMGTAGRGWGWQGGSPHPCITQEDVRLRAGGVGALLPIT